MLLPGALNGALSIAENKQKAQPQNKTEIYSKELLPVCPRAQIQQLSQNCELII